MRYDDEVGAPSGSRIVYRYSNTHAANIYIDIFFRISFQMDPFEVSF